MSGNILDQMERDRKKALNQGQKSIANPAVQANKAVQNAYNPAKVQNTVQKIGQSATKINNTVNKPVVGGVNNNMNKPVNALNRNTAMQRSANVERQLDDLERFNRDMKRNSVADTVYNNASSNYNRQMANNAIMANRQTINNSPSNWSNMSGMSEEEKQLANIEAFNNEVVRPARGLNLNSPSNLGGLAKTINNVPFRQNAPEGYDPKVDYAAKIDFAIKSGAPWEEIEKLYQMRDYKKSTNPEKYGQYDNDEYDLKAQTYINNNSMIDRLYDGQTDLYNQAVDLGLQNKLDALKLQGEQNKAKYDDIRSQAYSNARLSAIGNNEAMASMGLAGGLYSSPASGYSETSRMAQDNNLRSNISSAYRQEQEQLEELQALENEERRNAEAEKLSYLASMGDKKAQATLEKYYNDQNNEYLNKQLDETIRSNQANENIQNRTLDETIRSHKADEAISQGQLAELIRSNMVGEALSRDQLNELIRSNQAGEQISWGELNELIRHNKAGENISLAELREQARQANMDNSLGYANLSLNRDKLNFKKQQAETSDLDIIKEYGNFSKKEIMDNKAALVAAWGEDEYNRLLASKK